MSDTIQAKYILGKHSILGDPRRKWEDRVYVEEILRPDWDPLVVGIVADGVGSADFGSRGAQLAIDTVIGSLTQSQGNDIPDILESAIVAANSAVYQENQLYEGDGLSTLVVAIIAHERAYIGNVGDSRAYWVQSDGKVLLLTRDHSYFNVYGGDPNDEDAGVVVNAIGKKQDVQVDLGFYLKGDNLEQAYKLGISGLPLKVGDAILLCSDGLSKNAPQGERYVKDVEIASALKTETLPDRAAIKMVSMAEGRRPDDNVSAVTIQFLSGRRDNKLISRLTLPKLTLPKLALPRLTLPNLTVIPKWLIWVAIGFMGLLAMCVVVFITVFIINRINVAIVQPEAFPTPVSVATSTPTPSSLLNSNLAISYMKVQSVDSPGLPGQGATVKEFEQLENGRQVSTIANTGVKMIIGSSSANLPSIGMLYLFEQSSARIFFEEIMKPVLIKGAIYIQPGNPDVGEVYFEITEKVYAMVSGSRMILEIKGSDIWLYCFEGDCEWVIGDQKSKVSSGDMQAYHLNTENLEATTIPISYTGKDGKWDWNRRCNFCMSDIVPTPTPEPSFITQESEPTNGRHRLPTPIFTPRPPRP